MILTEKEACHFELIWVAIGPSHFGHLEAYYDLRKVKFCLNACVQKNSCVFYRKPRLNEITDVRVALLGTQ